MKFLDFYKSNSYLSSLSEEIIQLSRKQNYNKASRLFSEWISATSALAKELVEYKQVLDPDGQFSFETLLVQILKEILSAQESQDYILVADLMELNYIPFIYNIQDYIRNNDLLENDSQMQNEMILETNNKCYEVQETVSGYKTLMIKASDDSFYLCGNVNPQRDAMLLFDQYKDIEADSYIVYGLELGYLLNAIFRDIKNAVPVTVYESDENIINLAKQNTFVQQVINGYGNYNIVYDKDFSKFSEAIAKKTDKDVLIIHYPSVRNITNSVIREKMENLFVQDSSVRNQIVEIYSNMKSNFKVCNHYVDELEKTFEGKDVYLVAAGPSLDANIELLRNKPDNSIVLCVGRAYKKLMSIGVTPDYVVFLDAAERIYGQFASKEESSVPLILVSSTCKAIGINSKADKYLVCQKGMKEAEEYAAEHGYNTYSTGGSVATIAFDIALRLSAKRIIAVGLDLSYKDGKTHADGSFSKSIGDNAGLMKVNGQTGETLYTTRAMDMYRVWFEERISESKRLGEKCEFINATEGGVEIKGMKNMKLEGAIG